ncbi:hypothetical protein CaCOL14_006513 [Colletotrichum acutatum]
MSVTNTFEPPHEYLFCWCLARLANRKLKRARDTIAPCFSNVRPSPTSCIIVDQCLHFLLRWHSVPACIVCELRSKIARLHSLNPNPELRRQNLSAQGCDNSGKS